MDELMLKRTMYWTRALQDLFANYGAAGGVKVAFDVMVKHRVSLEVAGSPVTVDIRSKTSDPKVFRQVFISREYEHPCLPSDARLIVDAGANVGLASLFFAKRYPQATVLAIEPEASNFRTLSNNVRGCERIKPIQSALWPTRSRLGILDPKADKWAFQVTEARGDDASNGGIEAITVGDIIAREGRNVDILKIDIEGAEKELFEQGAQDWLPHVEMLIVETHDRFKPGCTSAIEHALANREHHHFNRGENDFYVLH